MQIIDTPVKNILEPAEDHLFSSDKIFMDIETTGLSRKYSKIYMIGLAYRSPEDNSIILRQYFADMIREERKLLQAFIKDMEIFHPTEVITFNGDRFDLLFIEERCRHFDLDFSFSDMASLDLYKVCHSHKNLLGLGSCRQKAIEEYLGIFRDDEFNGGQLIKVYEDYEKSPSEKSLHLLLLHNFEDVQNMLPLLVMTRFDGLKDAAITITSINEETAANEPSGRMILFRGKNSTALPHSIRLIGDGYHIILEKDGIRGALIPQEKILYHFLPNPGDYYYLPEEDIVIPKVLGESIDRSRKVKATKKNCYIKKDDIFVRLPDKMVPDCNAPLFQPEYASDELYADAKTITDDPAIIAEMIQFLLQK